MSEAQSVSERDRGMAIAMLAEAFSAKDMTPARIKIYEQALQKVPARCLEPMVQRAIETRKPRWGDLPTVAELREDAEAVRVELLQALGEPGCAQCEDQRGWVTVTHADGSAVERCRCWKRIQEQREALSAGDQPLAIPPAPPEPEDR